MPKSPLLEQVREVLRLRHYSIRTEEAYVHAIRRFILYHHKHHPREMGVDEVRQYLSHLATDGMSLLPHRTWCSAHCCFSTVKC